MAENVSSETATKQEYEELTESSITIPAYLNIAEILKNIAFPKLKYKSIVHLKHYLWADQTK